MVSCRTSWDTVINASDRSRWCNCKTSANVADGSRVVTGFSVTGCVRACIQSETAAAALHRRHTVMKWHATHFYELLSSANVLAHIGL